MQRVDLNRLGRIADFANAELADLRQKFADLTPDAYKNDCDKRRSVERCIENIVNASLDMAKVVLLSKGLRIPDRYRDYFTTLSQAGLLLSDTADVLASGVKLWNIIAHEYLDIRWPRIKQFITEDRLAFESFVRVIQRLVAEEVPE